MVKRKRHQKQPQKEQRPLQPPGLEMDAGRAANPKAELQIDEAFIRVSDREKALIEKIQDERKSKVVVFFAGDAVQMRDDIALQAYKILSDMGESKKLDLVIYSRGGQTEVPAKLIPLIRNYCENLGVIIPYRAHSAATHIAMGANEIIMGPMSELSPVDPSRTHPLLPKDKEGNPIPISVQDLKHVVDLLKREGPEESYTPEALATIFSTMFEYVHPLAMGAIEQSYALAKLISAKLLSTHMSTDGEEDLIQKIANEFSDGFKSHQYQIGWKEAKALGLAVQYDNGEVYEAAWKLYEEIVPRLNEPPEPKQGESAIARPIVVIGYERLKAVLFEISELTREGSLVKLKPIGARWISSNELS